MNILTKHLQFVNEQVGIQDRLAIKYKNQKWRSEKHISAAESFRSLAEDLVVAARQLDNLDQSQRSVVQSQQTKQIRLLLTPEEVEDLPEELRSELSISGGADKTEFAIVQTIDASGGVASLDQILVGVYRRTNEIHKRSSLISRLYRMSGKGLVFPVPAKKGVYSIRQLTESEAAKLLGSDASEEDSEE